MAESALANREDRPRYAAYDGPMDSDSIRNFAADYDGPEDPRFPGCAPVAMTIEEFESYEGGVEYWSAESRTAWILRDGGPDHEGPGGYLAGLVTRISLERGSPIRCWGALRIATLDADGRSMESMHPDQSIYLHPGVWTPSGASTVVGRDPRPDVVLEVDHTTDIRRNKLAVYKRWKFPEVWVETPDAPSPSRPRGVVPGVRIYVLGDDDYVEKAASAALPTWRAVDIHRALNQPVPSEGIIAHLVRVGRTLGDREGTGPMDDAQIAGYMRRSHEVGRRTGLARGREIGRELGVEEGRAQGVEEGRAQGVAEGLAYAAAAILRGKGIALPGDFEQRLAGRTVAPDVLLGAAQSCSTVSEFWARL